MQAIVKLTLKRPGELRMLDLAGLEQELIGVHFDSRRFETNLHLDSARGRASAEIKEWVLVTRQFPFHIFQKLVGR